MGWLRRLRGTLLGSSAADDVDEEVAFHLDERTDEYVRRGLTPENARREALQRFGNVTRAREQVHDANALRWLDDARADTRYALRVLRRNPGFTAAALAALAIGIGANTAVFSVVNTVLLRPLQVPNAERIVRFAETYQGIPSSPTGLTTFNIWRRQTDAFEDVSAHWLEFANLTTASYPEQVPVARVSAGFFRLFGAPVTDGRTFTDEEDRPGGPSIVVLSDELWHRQFGANSAIVGRSVTLGGVSRVVVGVLARGFDTEQFDQRPDAWVPFQVDPTTPERGTLAFVTGRLKNHVTLAAANAQLQPVAEEWRSTFPERQRATAGFTVMPLRDAMVGDVRAGLLILVGAVVLVLLIACANVASLLLVRAMDRGREMAIRAAIGAGRGRIVRQLLAESIVLAVTGGLLGLGIGAVGIRALLGAYPGNNPLVLANRTSSIPRLGQGAAAVAVDWRVVVFAGVVSLLTGIVFGLLPAIRSSRTELTSALRQTSAADGGLLRGNTLRTTLIVGEIALALALLIGSGLLIRTSRELLTVNRGFDLHNVLTMRMSVSGTAFETRAGIERLTRGGLDRIRNLQAVTAASTSCCVPLETVWQLPFVVAGRPLTGTFHGFAGWTFVSPGYFDAFHIPVLRGRSFTDRDDASAPGVVIINETMARRLWPASEPLTAQLLIGRSMRPEYKDDPVRQVIGIVGDVRDQALNRSPRPAMYVPVAQVPDGVTALNVRLLPLTWIVRTSADSSALRDQIERELVTASGGLPVTKARSMDQVATESTARTRFYMLLMTVFACSALALAATGIYGLLAFTVKQRTHEIGIRMALGAEPRAIRTMVITQSMVLTLVGVSVGIAAAFVLTRFLSSLLFGVTQHDPALFIALPLVFIAVASVATWLPARQATRTDPLLALRHE